MSDCAAFLIIDSDEDSQSNLARILTTAFSQSVIQHAGDLDIPAISARGHSFDIVIYKV